MLGRYWDGITGHLEEYMEREHGYADQGGDGQSIRRSRNRTGDPGIQFLLGPLFCRDVGILGSEGGPIVGTYRTVPPYLQQ